MDGKYIKKKWLNPERPGGLSGLTGFVKNQSYKNKEEVEKVLSELSTYTLHKPAIKHIKHRRRIVVAFIDLIHSADLIDYRNLGWHNSNYKYVLLVVDMFSKYVWTKPLKRKTGEELERAISQIFKESKRIPKYYFCDEGSEFYNGKVKKLFDKHNITLYSTFSRLKAMVSEVHIKKLKTKMSRWMTHENSKNWLTALPKITKAMNAEYHNSIKMAPNNVTKKNEAEVFHNLYEKLINSDPIKSKYSVGDVVRVAINKVGTFKKGYEQNYSDSLFQVVKINRTAGAPTYTLKDIKSDEEVQGSYYNEDLVLVIGTENNDE